VTTRRRFILFVLVLVGVLPFEINGWYNPRLAATPRLFWLVESGTWIVLPAVLLLIGLRGRLFTLSDIGLGARIRGQLRPILLGFLLVAVPLGLYWLDQWAVATAVRTWPHNFWAVGFHYSDMVPPAGPDTGWWRLLTIVHLSVAAGVVEEVLYRGMLSRVFPGTAAGAAAFVAVSLLLFVPAHWEGGIRTCFEAAVFGLAAALLFRLTHNLWPLIVAHVVIDFGWLFLASTAR
jgi:membrane protease YdiL (CAAX protease family)